MGKIVAAAVLAACIQPPELGPHETCAQSALLLNSISTTGDETHGVAVGPGGIASVSVESSSGTTTCRRAMTANERCEIEGYLASSAFKLHYKTGKQNLYQTIGYIVFLVPGIILHATYANEVEAAGEESARVGTRAKLECLNRCGTDCRM